jgi:hypothetical protein
MLSVELQELLWAVGKEGWRQLESQRCSRLELRGFEFRPPNYGGSCGQERTIQRIPHVIQVGLRFLYQVVTTEGVGNLLMGDWKLGTAIPRRCQQAQVDCPIQYVQDALKLPRS